jgi:hypothetical protein
MTSSAWSRRFSWFSPRRSFAEVSLVVALGLVAGCQPKIGASCEQHTDCSSSGGRICDPNFPGGYCTVFNCEPGSCPSEAVCVAYQTVPSTVPACANVLDQRLQRTYCMLSCGSDSDCRGGYACVDISKANPWGAVIAEQNQRSGKICTLALSGAAESIPANEAQVCEPPDASFPDATILLGAGLAATSDAASAPSRPDARAPRKDASPTDASGDGP